MIDVRIQPMTVSHLNEILEIEKTLFPTPWTRRMFEEELGRSSPVTYAVAGVWAGRVIGYTIAWFLLDEVHLVNIAVHEKWQRRGVGSFLLNHLIDGACTAGATVITLEVRRSNTVAQEFYGGYGFKKIAVRRGYYSDNREDAVLMAMDLVDLIERRKRGPRKPSVN